MAQVVIPRQQNNDQQSGALIGAGVGAIFGDPESGAQAGGKVGGLTSSGAGAPQPVQNAGTQQAPLAMPPPPQLAQEGPKTSDAMNRAYEEQKRLNALSNGS